MPELAAPQPQPYNPLTQTQQMTLLLALKNYLTGDEQHHAVALPWIEDGNRELAEVARCLKDIQDNPIASAVLLGRSSLPFEPDLTGPDKWVMLNQLTGCTLRVRAENPELAQPAVELFEKFQKYASRLFAESSAATTPQATEASSVHSPYAMPPRALHSPSRSLTPLRHRHIHSTPPTLRTAKARPLPDGTVMADLSITIPLPLTNVTGTISPSHVILELEDERSGRPATMTPPLTPPRPLRRHRTLSHGLADAADCDLAAPSSAAPPPVPDCNGLAKTTSCIDSSLSTYPPSATPSSKGSFSYDYGWGVS